MFKTCLLRAPTATRLGATIQRRSCAAAPDVAAKKNDGAALRTDNAPRDGPIMTYVALAGCAGVGGFLYWYLKASEGELALRKHAAERQAKMASGELSVTDPNRLSKDLEDYLRKQDPELGGALAHFGTLLGIYGMSDQVAELLSAHEEASRVIQIMKQEHDAMSWADLGSFLVFHTLKEMGGPLVGLYPLFGRSETESARRRQTSQKKMIPAPGASYAEFRAWGDQFQLSDAELCAILGGNDTGSLLFSDAPQRNISVEMYRTFHSAKVHGEPTDNLAAAAVLDHSDFTRACAEVYARDYLYWNLHFARAFEKVMSHGWYHLRELPDRFGRTTQSADWSARQQSYYLNEMTYQGSVNRTLNKL